MFRVSHVEAFRQWEADDEADTDDLIARIRGEDTSSELMLAGTAFHKALETAPTGIEVSEMEANGYLFCITDDLEIGLCPVRELRASKAYMVDGRPIVISGQVDQMEGLRIEDHKTTGHFDPERYLQGCQWKLYLDIFGCERFRWNIFEIAAMDEPKTYQVHGQHTVEQFRYPLMEQDCQALVERFARFVREHLDAAPTLTSQLRDSIAANEARKAA